MLKVSRLFLKIGKNGCPRHLFSYICPMFVRQKKNPSGIVSVQVIDKSRGSYKVVKTIGSSSNPFQIEELVCQGNDWIKSQSRQVEIDFDCTMEATEVFLSQIEQIKPEGAYLLLSPIFHQIGFSQIEDQLFKELSLVRLCYPVSKLKTRDYLHRHHYQHWSVWQIYRYLDKLHQSQKERIQQISFTHTKQVLGGDITIVFYDVTTLYFESDNEDELRCTGFSKEGKHQNPQILLGLLVSIDGYPLAYEIFEGNKFEGHTMLPVVEGFKQKYNIDKLVVIADAGLMSEKNVEELIEKGYEFILGARIKNESSGIKQKILSYCLKDGETAVIEKEASRLIINYSQARANKDKHNREKGLLKLQKKIHSGKLTKSHINNKGYNKYLKMDGEVVISIDFARFEEDTQWDGLKGYLTNASLTNQQILDNYKQLWKIEKAFKVNKHDLRIRPIYHRIKRRIEAHICISFVAYKLYKELERKLKEKHSSISPERAIEIAESIYTVTVKIPNSRQVVSKTILTTPEQRSLAKLFDF